MEYHQGKLFFHRDGRGRSLIGFVPVCETCGSPAPEPHGHLSTEIEMIVRELKAVQDKPEPVGEREHLTLKQLANYSGRSERWLRDRIKDPVDPMPASKPGGGKITVARSAFDAWMARHRDRGGVSVSGVVDQVLDEIRRGN